MYRFKKSRILLLPISLACAQISCSDDGVATSGASDSSSGSTGDTTTTTTGQPTTTVATDTTVDPTVTTTDTTVDPTVTTTDTTVDPTVTTTIDPTTTTEAATDTSDTSDTSTSTTGGELCGNDVREDDEECDEGELNADDWNCMADCTINPVQRFILDQDDAAIAADAKRSDEQAAVGQGSWCNTPGDDLNGDGLDKFEIYWDPEEPVPLRDDDDPFFYNWGPTMVAEIADVQYSTRRPAEQAGLDFFMIMYTRADGIDDKGAFYGYRLTGVPWRALRLDHNVDVWDTFRLAAPMGTEPNTATFFDTAFTDEFGMQPTLADLLATMVFDWMAFSPQAKPSMIDYGAEMVRFLSLHTASNWNTFEGCVDAITVFHTDGRQLIIDPE